MVQNKKIQGATKHDKFVQFCKNQYVHIHGKAYNCEKYEYNTRDIVAWTAVIWQGIANHQNMAQHLQSRRKYNKWCCLTKLTRAYVPNRTNNCIKYEWGTWNSEACRVVMFTTWGQAVGHPGTKRWKVQQIMLTTTSPIGARGLWVKGMQYLFIYKCTVILKKYTSQHLQYTYTKRVVLLLFAGLNLTLSYESHICHNTLWNLSNTSSCIAKVICYAIT